MLVSSPAHFRPPFLMGQERWCGVFQVQNLGIRNVTSAHITRYATIRMIALHSNRVADTVLQLVHAILSPLSEAR